MMGRRTTKIDQLGLGDRIQELVAQDLSARAIARRLRNERPDIDISDSTVSRRVAEIREAAQDVAFGKIREHVDKVIPDDLAALEEIEAMALDWSREAGKDRVDRMAEAAVQIAGEVTRWKDLFLTSEPGEEAKLAQKIIQRCLAFMAREDRLQKNRIKAMETAIKVIDLKLRQAGLLDDEGKGRIVIVDRQSQESRDPDPNGREVYRAEVTH